MSNVILSLIVFVLYSVLAVYFWRALQAGRGEQLSQGAAGHLLVLPLSVHGYLLLQELFVRSGLSFGVLEAVSLIAWVTLLVYWLARFFYPIGSLQALVLPVAAVAAVLPVFFPAQHALTHTGSVMFRLHFVLAMLAYSLYTIALLHAVLIAQVEKRLHSARMPRILQGLPPLLTMESLLFRLIGAGFVLLTLTLLSGVLFSEQIFGKPWQFNHKTLIGMISWLVFAILLLGHHFYGWRGQTAVRWTIAGFVLLLLAYVGSQFVFQIVLGR